MGLGGFAIGFAGSWNPSLWCDEAATISSANRPLADLVDMTAHRIDGVHGLYYLFMYGWFRLFGISEVTARLPSAIAIAIAAAALVILGQMMATPRIAVLAGAVFVVLPRTTWASTEARSYAMSVAVAVLLTIVLVAALRRRDHRLWILYGAGVAVAVLLFVYLGTVVAAHLVTVLLRRRRDDLLRWALSAGAGFLAVVPFLAVVRDQSDQVDWIRPIDRHFVTTVLEDQWFLGSVPVAIAAWSLLAAGAVRLWQRPVPGVLAVVLPWILIPMALILAYSLVIDPIYLDRYLILAAPAVALLLACCIDRLAPSTRVGVALVAGLALLAVPAWIDQREAYSKFNGSDFSRTADYIEDHARAGECVVYDFVDWNPGSLRTAAEGRPDSFEKLRDIGLGESRIERRDFHDETLPITAIADRVAGCSTIWVLTDEERTTSVTNRHTSNEIWHLAPNHFEAEEIYRTLVAAGFRIGLRHEVHVTQIVRMDRI